MAVTANSIITAQAVQSDQNVCTAAKTTYGDGANAVLLMSAGANGSVVYAITAIPRGTLAAATKLMLFKSNDAGTTLAYINAVVVASYTDAATTAPTQSTFGYSETNPLRLKASERLYIGIFAASANGIQVDCQSETL
jgi:hypothetical protein